LAALTPAEGIAAMIACYADERVDGCDVEDEGDMLLYQWGVNDWGAGEAFEVNITRQLIVADDEDDGPRQLSLTFRFEPCGALRAVRGGNRWCASPRGVAAFSRFVTSSRAYGAVDGLPVAQVSLTFGRT
jgi:hypothetical protein